MKTTRDTASIGHGSGSTDPVRPAAVRGHLGIPLLVMGVAFVLTLLLAYRTAASDRARASIRFDALVRETQSNLVDQIETYLALLRATRGLLVASDSVTLADFRAFVGRLDLPGRYRGIQGIGYSRRLPAEELPSFVAAMRSELGPDFTVHPEDPRHEYHPIIYLEPLDRRNQAAIGYDMFTEPTRRTAMERARDTGRPVASGRVTLVQEIDLDKQAGFLIYLPFYGGITPPSVAERRDLLEGFVYSPFRAGDLLSGTFGDQSDPQIEFSLYAGSSPAPELLLHESHPEPAATDYTPSFERVTSFELLGRTWSLAIATLPAFDTDDRIAAVPLILIAGTAVSLVLFGLTWSQAGARTRAELALADLKASQEALAESQERMNLILEHALDAVITMDAAGTITSWNARAEFLFGWPRKEAVGRSLADTIVPPSLRESHRRGLERYLASGHGPVLNRRIEVTAVRRDGTEFPVELSIAAVQTRDGVIFSGFVSDITARKRAEADLIRAHEQLEQRVEERTAELALVNRELAQHSRRAVEATRFKSEFLASMSHELRTPLNAIIGFAKLMKAGKAGAITPDQTEFLGDILTSSEHLLQLVNDILDLAKVEAGKIEFRPEEVELGRIVGEVRDILRGLAASRRVHVTVDVDRSIGHVVLDPSRLKQVLYNFMSNALKFTPEGGSVTVRALPDVDQHFRIEVEDTGIGINAEDVKRLFLEFQQVGGTAAKKYPGTGLGLALTRQIVEAQGGRVGVRSIEGQGSVFFAVLPCVGAGQVSKAMQGAALKTRPTVPVVLVVEDDPHDRDWLVRTLSDAGITCEVASTGGQAITMARAKRYDAITVDLLLPDIHGQDVIHALGEEGPNRETPIIIVTVLAEHGLGLGARVHDVLSKPVSPEEMIAAIDRVGVRRDGSPVLIVDDDPQALKLAQTALETAGYRAVCRSNGENGLRAAREERPAAVVLDLFMPEMDGFEFLKRFRAEPAGHSVPVLVWSVADLTHGERERLLALAQGVVQKGKGAQILLDELRLYLRAPIPVVESRLH